MKNSLQQEGSTEPQINTASFPREGRPENVTSCSVANKEFSYKAEIEKFRQYKDQVILENQCASMRVTSKASREAIIRVGRLFQLPGNALKEYLRDPDVGEVSRQRIQAIKANVENIAGYLQCGGHRDEITRSSAPRNIALGSVSREAVAEIANLSCQEIKEFLSNTDAERVSNAFANITN